MLLVRLYLPDAFVESRELVFRSFTHILQRPVSLILLTFRIVGLLDLVTDRAHHGTHLEL